MVAGQGQPVVWPSVKLRQFYALRAEVEADNARRGGH